MQPIESATIAIRKNAPHGVEIIQPPIIYQQVPGSGFHVPRSRWRPDADAHPFVEEGVLNALRFQSCSAFRVRGDAWIDMRDFKKRWRTESTANR